MESYSIDHMTYYYCSIVTTLYCCGDMSAVLYLRSLCDHEQLSAIFGSNTTVEITAHARLTFVVISCVDTLHVGIC